MFIDHISKAVGNDVVTWEGETCEQPWQWDQEVAEVM